MNAGKLLWTTTRGVPRNTPTAFQASDWLYYSSHEMNKNTRGLGIYNLGDYMVEDYKNYVKVLPSM